MGVYTENIRSFFMDSGHLLADFNLQFAKLINGLLNIEPATWSSAQSSSLSLGMLFNILAIEMETVEQELSPMVLISQLFDVIKRKLSPNPCGVFEFKVEEQITCVISGGVSARKIDQRFIEVGLKQSLNEALEVWSNDQLEDFFSPSLQCQSPGLRSRKFLSAPDELIISVKRFFKNNNWIQEEYQINMHVEDQERLRASVIIFSFFNKL